MLSSLIATVDSPTDKELITQLYNTYKQFMYNISMSILGKREDAEDAVQDSFVRIIDNLDKINNPYSRKTKSYITVITKNVCLDMIRRNHNDEELEDKDIPFEDSYTDFENSNATYEQIIKNRKAAAAKTEKHSIPVFCTTAKP